MRRIFGPTKDWECHCGKYKRIRYKGIVCDKCGVEVTKAKVRRERMGHIKLASPVSHIWYFKGIPSRMGLVLDISPRTLEKVLYFANFIVTDPGNTEFAYKEILTGKSVSVKLRMIRPITLKRGWVQKSIKELLMQIDLEELSSDLKTKLATATGQKKIRIVRRLEVVEALQYFWKQAGMDDSGRYSSDPAGSASDGTARWRQIRNIRPQRPVQTCHQQK